MTQYALQFNGTTQQASAPSTADLQLTNDFEISITFALANLTQTQKYLLIKGNNEYAIIWNYNANKIELFDLNSTLRQYSGITISDTNYHTVTYRYTGGVFTAILDGTTVSQTTVTTSLASGSGTLYLGSAGGSNYAAVNVDYLAIKKAGVLTAEWKFLEGTGTTVADDIHTNTLTTVNSPAWVVVPTNTVWQGSATLNANGNLSATGLLTSSDGATLGAYGNLTATPAYNYSDSASLNAVSSLSATGVVNTQSSATLLANGNLSASGTNNSQQSGSAGLNALSTMNADGIVTAQDSSDLNATSSLNANVIQMMNVTIALTATSNLSADGTTSNTLIGQANLSANAGVNANGIIVLDTVVSINANGTLRVLTAKPIEEVVNLFGSRMLSATLKGGIPMKEKQDFTIVAGNTLNLVASLTEQDGTPIDLSGVTDIRWGFGKTNIGVRKDMSTGIAITDPTNGVVTIQLLANDTKNREEISKHELTVTDASGNISTVLRGNITIQQNII